MMEQGMKLDIEVCPMHIGPCPSSVVLQYLSRNDPPSKYKVTESVGGKDKKQKKKPNKKATRDTSVHDFYLFLSSHVVYGKCTLMLAFCLEENVNRAQVLMVKSFLPTVALYSNIHSHTFTHTLTCIHSHTHDHNTHTYTHCTYAHSLSIAPMPSHFLMRRSTVWEMARVSQTSSLPPPWLCFTQTDISNTSSRMGHRCARLSMPHPLGMLWPTAQKRRKSCCALA